MERKKLPCDGGAVGSMGEAMRCASTNFTNSTTVVVPAPTVTMLAKPPAVSSNEYYFFEFGASPPRCSTSCTMTRNQAATWSTSAPTRMWRRICATDVAGNAEAKGVEVGWVVGDDSWCADDG